MKTGLLRQKKLRFFLAHTALAVLALAGAIGLQWLWQSKLPEGFESWRPYLAAVLLLTTAWLVATAWFHVQLTSRHDAIRQTLLNAAADVAIGAFAAFILVKGHSSPFALTGLWPLVPLLIAIAIPSALLLFATAVANGLRPDAVSQNIAGYLRLVFAMPLTGYLLALASL